jgi:hypothetical protein
MISDSKIVQVFNNDDYQWGYYCHQGHNFKINFVPDYSIMIHVLLIIPIIKTHSMPYTKGKDVVFHQYTFLASIS